MGYDRLRCERCARGFSQQQLAALLGLRSRNAYALKERGERRFTIEEGLLIARVMKISVEELFSDTRVNKTVTKECVP